jgi:uncharacterized protein (DUF1499 family)
MRMVATGLIWFFGAVAVLAVGFGIYVRVAPSDPARWHVDPVTAERPAFPGAYLMRPDGGDAAGPVFALPPADLLAALDRVAQATPRVQVLAGSVADGQITYVARSALWGFPDYVSVRAVPVDGGAQLAILSRLRFGHDDMGVNKARVEDWVAQLQAGGA